MTDAKSNPPLHQALFRILRPMARLLLRNGVPFGEFSELVKRAYVELRWRISLTGAANQPIPERQ